MQHRIFIYSRQTTKERTIALDSQQRGSSISASMVPPSSWERGAIDLWFSHKETHLLYRRLVNWLPGHYTASGHRVTCVTLHYIQTACSILHYANLPFNWHSVDLPAYLLSTQKQNQQVSHTVCGVKVCNYKGHKNSQNIFFRQNKSFSCNCLILCGLHEACWKRDTCSLLSLQVGTVALSLLSSA